METNKVLKNNPVKIKKALLNKVLKERFGHDSLREGQAEVIESVLAGQHTLAIMPTGAGKSLCYQLPALLMPGTTLVVSPLIALMKDQKEKLDDLSIDALELNSTLKDSEQTENIKTLNKGRTEFLYVTPEKLISKEFLSSLEGIEIDLMVIDEAHCISQWGHDFRPAYLSLVEAWRTLKKPRVLALTATATAEVIEDIKVQLGLPDLRVFCSGVFRKNLHYEAVHVMKETEKIDKIVELLKTLEGNGIIYCATVKSAEQIYDYLFERDYPVDIYHGKLSASDRTENRRRFMAGENRIMIATNAFGMGIDKPDIRYIIHFQFPGCLEAYYQESGRAGRDGLPSRCILIYLKQDKRTQSFFLAGKYPNFDDMVQVYSALKVLTEKQGSFEIKEVQDMVSVAKTKTRVLIALLRDAGVVTASRNRLKLKRSDLSEAQLTAAVDEYQKKKQADQDKLKQMIIYSQTALCRWKILLEYFGDKTEWERCHHCDNCEKTASRLVEEVRA